MNNYLIKTRISASPRRRTGSSTPSRCGFALILSLGLMALMVLLMLTLTALISVESYASRSQLDTAMARQNALVGLMSGISALQSAAGPDQRVTATADILSNSATSNKAWTGVWKSDGVSGYSSSSPVWLVSGARPSVTAVIAMPATNNTIVLMRSAFTGLNNETHEAIRLPKSPLVPASQIASSGASNATTTAAAGNDGFYAYWISDEGVKAKVNIATDPENVEETNTYAAAILPKSNGVQFVEGLDKWNTLSTSQLDRMGSLRSLNYMTSLSATDIGTKAQDDLTVDSVGLLTDVRNGGLKLDLTSAFGSDTLFGDFYGTANKSTSTNNENFFLINHTATRLNDTNLNKFKTAGPRMSLLRDYARFYKNLESNGSVITRLDSSIVDNATSDGYALSQYPRVLGRLPYTTQKSGEILNQFINGVVSFDKHMLVPAISYFQFGFRLRPNINLPKKLSDASTGYPFQLESQMFVALYNPYNVTISLYPDGDYLRMQSAISPYIHLRVTHSGTSSSTVTEYWADAYKSMNLSTVSASHYQRFSEITVPPGQVRVYGVAQRVGTVSTMSNTFNPNTYQINPATGSMSMTTAKTTTPSSAAFVSLGDKVEILEASMFPDPDSFVGRNLARTNDYQMRFSITTREYMFYNSLSPIWYTTMEDGYNSQTWKTVSRAETEVTQSSGSFNAIEIGAWAFNMRHTRSDFGSRVIFDNNIRTLYSTSFADKTTDIKIPSIYEFSSGDTSMGTPDATWGYVSTEACSPPQISGTSNARGWWGNDVSSSGADTVILFDMARCPPLSIGAFQHASLGLYASEPSYVAGNSYANRRIDQKDLYASNGSDICVYDISYLVNDALWDPFFFSGLERDGGSTGSKIKWSSWNSQSMLSNHVNDPLTHPLPNPRLYIEKPIEDGAVQTSDFFSEDKDNYRKIGALLRVNGPFNVNSTSTQAWKALLMGMNGAELPILNPISGAVTTATVSDEKTAFPRMAFSGGGEFDGASGDNFWKGYRTLSENEATTLASKIVDQVRLRGPFRSMADFVNRRLVSGDLGVSGALQSAIDAAKLNDGVSSNYSKSPKTVSGWNSAPDNTKTGDGFPGTVMQGDILQALAPVLTVRSDTFRIRSYGDVLGPSGEVVSKAYCEAVVQRVPEYILTKSDDSENGSEIYDGTRTAGGYTSTVSTLNQNLGRRFKIVSFRWLNPNEI